ncbi:MAG: endonuclease/exonuclease/phosphatase family protein [bacterium]|nr:endonuclease/exonuclease/phosphatase family protein [bacterium]
MTGRRGWPCRPVLGIGLGALAVGASCASPMVGLDGFIGELAASWRPHIALGVAVCAAMALMVRLRLLAALLTALAVVLGADVVRTEMISAQAQVRSSLPEDGALRIAFSNVLVVNDDTGRLVAWIEKSDPDIVVATEMSPRHVEQMAEFMADYPFRVLEPREHPYGMVVYSRYPISSEAVTELADGTPSTPDPVMVTVGVETPAGTLHVTGLHPCAPVTPRRLARRNEQFAMAGDILAQLDAPKIVAGDFNATPWSAGLRAFLRNTRLTGFNTRATWPVWLGFAGIPIDHALASRDLRILDIETGPNIGSDHRPILIDVALAGPETAHVSP